HVPPLPSLPRKRRGTRADHGLSRRGGRACPVASAQPARCPLGDCPMSTAPAITTRGLTLRYSGAERRALDDISFDVFTGEILGILGATGAGKSTLLQVLAGVIPHHAHDAAFRGVVNILGRDIDDYGSLTAIAAEVGLVVQDPEVQLVNTVVREELAWGMENRGVPIPEM